MKLIYSILLLIFVVILGGLAVMYLKLQAIEERMETKAGARDVQEQFEELRANHQVLQSDFNKVYGNLADRIKALESGVAEKQPRGPKTPGFVLAELERQIHLKRDAEFVPEDEMLAQKKIDTAVVELEEMERAEGGVVPRLIERVRVSRDPYVRATLIRDVAWRLGPTAVSGLMELFRDKDFTSNLRVLAARAALKAGGDESGLLGEFLAHLADTQEYLTVKTGLVPIFRDHPYEPAVDLLVDGARNPGYPPQHRTDCLLALAKYDHPKVIQALEEILVEPDEESFVKNFSIQAYNGIMRDKAAPFFKRLIEDDKLDPPNRTKVESILKKYEDD